MEAIETQPKNRLWTYDFTVITIGSVVSMVGGTLSGFAVSLVVLDYTSSTFLYVLFNVCYQLPMLVCPILAGPCLDRVSRKRVIYTLDFRCAASLPALFEQYGIGETEVIQIAVSKLGGKNTFTQEPAPWVISGQA